MEDSKGKRDALAMAVAVRRHNMKKKMAAGGMVPDEDMGENMDPIAKGMSSENEDLNPMNEPEHGAEDKMLRTQKLGRMAQEHEVIDEPAEPKRSLMAPKMMAHGGMMHPSGIAQGVMKKRMAAGGMVDHELSIDENDDDPRDTFLTADMPDYETGSDHTAMEDDEMEEAPEMRRKKMLSGIMSGLAMRHMGK